MEHNNEYELVVCQGKLPWWKIIVASLLFSYMIYMLYSIFLVLYSVELEKINPKGIASDIKYACLGFAGGVSFSMTKDILIDLDTEKLVSIYMVGPFSKKRISTLPQLEYVSIFFNSKEQYEVNIWYKSNKHYNMYHFNEKKPALLLAAKTAIKLNIDLLDATEKGNSEWLDKNTI